MKVAWHSVLLQERVCGLLISDAHFRCLMEGGVAAVEDGRSACAGSGLRLCPSECCMLAHVVDYRWGSFDFMQVQQPNSHSEWWLLNPLLRSSLNSGF